MVKNLIINASHQGQKIGIYPLTNQQDEEEPWEDDSAESSTESLTDSFETKFEQFCSTMEIFYLLENYCQEENLPFFQQERDRKIDFFLDHHT